MTDRQRWQLRGSVHTCRLDRTWGGGSGDSTFVEFRIDGAMVRRWVRGPDGAEWTTTNEFDDRGRLLVVRTEGSSPGVVDYEYDEQGRLSRAIGDGHANVRYTYDEKGGKREDQDLSPGVDAYATEGSDAAYPAHGAAVMSTWHDATGRVTLVQFTTAQGEPVSRIDFVYDACGNLVEEAQTRESDLIPATAMGEVNEAQLLAIRQVLGGPMRRTHRYDEHGRRIESRWGIVPIGEEVRRVSYNEHGDVSEEVSEMRSSEMGVTEAGEWMPKPGSDQVHGSEVRYEYEYDERGNWVRKTVDDTVERRTITYYAG